MPVQGTLLMEYGSTNFCHIRRKGDRFCEGVFHRSPWSSVPTNSRCPHSVISYTELFFNNYIHVILIKLPYRSNSRELDLETKLFSQMEIS